MSSKKQPSRFRFVVDEDLGRTYYEVLARDNRFDCDLFSTFWPPGTPDPVWLPELEARGLVVITHDKKLRRQHKTVIRESNATVIVSVGKADFEGQAEAFIASWPVIERALIKNPPPRILRFRRPSPAQVAKKLKPKGTVVVESWY